MAEHTAGPRADNLTDAALAALVEARRREHESRSPREGWRLTYSALRRWRRGRRTLTHIPAPGPRGRRQADNTTPGVQRA